MLGQVADGVYVHESEFIQSNTTVVQGCDGVLLVDPGITGDEMADLAADLRELGQPVVAAFFTHPDWDHPLWQPDFGDAPRYGTALNATTIGAVLASPGWRKRVAEGLSPGTRRRDPDGAARPYHRAPSSLGTARRSGSSSIVPTLRATSPY